MKIAASLARQHQSQLILLHTIAFDPILPNPVATTTLECEHEQELTEQAMENLRKSPAWLGFLSKSSQQVGMCSQSHAASFPTSR